MAAVVGAGVGHRADWGLVVGGYCLDGELLRVANRQPVGSPMSGVLFLLEGTKSVKMVIVIDFCLADEEETREEKEREDGTQERGTPKEIYSTFLRRVAFAPPARAETQGCSRIQNTSSSSRPVA